MGIFKKKQPEDPKKIKVVDVSKKVNAKPKKSTMWCTMHNCNKTACPKMHD